MSLRIMSPRSPGGDAASPSAGATIDRRGRSADSRRVARAVEARWDSPKSSSCSRAARTWAARARSRESSQARLPYARRAAQVVAAQVLAAADRRLIIVYYLVKRELRELFLLRVYIRVRNPALNRPQRLVANRLPRDPREI